MALQVIQQAQCRADGAAQSVYLLLVLLEQDEHLLCGFYGFGGYLRDAFEEEGDPFFPVAINADGLEQCSQLIDPAEIVHQVRCRLRADGA